MRSVALLVVALLGSRGAACGHGWSSECRDVEQSCSSAAQVADAARGRASGPVALKLCGLGLQCNAGYCTPAVNETMDELLDDLRSNHGNDCTSSAHCGRMLKCLPSTPPGSSKQEKRCRWSQATGVAGVTACRYSEECQGRCGEDGLCTAGPLASVGEPCTVDEQCKKKLYCSGGTTCAHQLPSGRHGNSSDSQLQCPAGELCVVFAGKNDPHRCQCTLLRSLRQDVKFRVPHDPTGTLRSMVCSSTASFATPDGSWYECVRAATMQQEGGPCNSTPHPHLECVCAANGDSVLAVKADENGVPAIDRFVPPPEMTIADATSWYLSNVTICGALHVPRYDLRFEACMAQLMGGFDKFCLLRQRPRQGPNSTNPVFHNLGVAPCAAGSLWHQLGRPSTHEAEVKACEHRSALCGYEPRAGVNMCGRSSATGGSPSQDDGTPSLEDAQWVIYGAVIAATLVAVAVLNRRTLQRRAGPSSPRGYVAFTG